MHVHPECLTRNQLSITFSTGIYIYTPLTVKMRSNHMHLWIRVGLKVLHQHLQIYALKCQNSHIKTARWIRINNRPCLHVQYWSHNLCSLLYHVYILYTYAIILSKLWYSRLILLLPRGCEIQQLEMKVESS